MILHSGKQFYFSVLILENVLSRAISLSNPEIPEGRKDTQKFMPQYDRV
jgi:hypothetical protein